jgi:hypothetical protein
MSRMGRTRMYALLSQPASTFLISDDPIFNGFAHKVEADVNSVLSNYDITEKKTLRELLMKQGATQSADGRLHLIDPKATLAL